MSKKSKKGYGEGTPVMICGKCPACKAGRGNCSNPPAALCLLNTMLLLAAPVAVVALLVKGVRR